tara:strand:- start:121 stop:327 length:207 start_codon:yes stop_codon:yes gene_type:complete
MNEDNLNMEIRKFLKKVGISSQRLIENEIHEADKKGIISLGNNLDIEMTLSIKSLNFNQTISGQIKIE